MPVVCKCLLAQVFPNWKCWPTSYKPPIELFINCKPLGRIIKLFWMKITYSGNSTVTPLNWWKLIVLAIDDRWWDRQSQVVMTLIFSLERWEQFWLEQTIMSWFTPNFMKWNERRDQIHDLESLELRNFFTWIMSEYQSNNEVWHLHGGKGHTAILASKILPNRYLTW